MRLRADPGTYPDIRIERANLLPYINNGYRAAIRKLTDSYRARKPAAILVSESRIGSRHVVERFLENVEEDAVVIRIDASCDGPKDFMKELIRHIGFEPKDLSLSDLESVFELFLQYQRKYRLRTIIIVQDSDQHGWWVMDKIRRLVEREAEERCGLKVIVSGPPSVISVLNEPILDVITASAGDRIVLSPFALSDTRKYVGLFAASIDADAHEIEDVSELFEFTAVTLIHEICAGVPDAIDQLCDRCVEIFDSAQDKLISTHTVRKAASLAGLTLDSDQDGSRDLDGTGEVARPGRLVVATAGVQDFETVLDQSCYVIGRSPLCNIRIHGLGVSRFHAMLSLSTNGLHVVDLGSTNGIRVNERKVNRFLLRDNDVITIGGSRMTYIAGSEQLTMASDMDPTDAYEVCDEEPEPCITYLGKDMRWLRTS